MSDLDARVAELVGDPMEVREVLAQLDNALERIEFLEKKNVLRIKAYAIDYETTHAGGLHKVSALVEFESGNGESISDIDGVFSFLNAGPMSLNDAERKIKNILEVAYS